MKFFMRKKDNQLVVRLDETSELVVVNKGDPLYEKGMSVIRARVTESFSFSGIPGRLELITDMSMIQDLADSRR